MVVYSYGPFSDIENTNKESSGHRVLGHGVVVKYTGTNAHAYIQEKSLETDMSVHLLTDITDQSVMDRVEKMLENGILEFLTLPAQLVKDLSFG